MQIWLQSHQFQQPDHYHIMWKVADISAPNSFRTLECSPSCAGDLSTFRLLGFLSTSAIIVTALLYPDFYFWHVTNVFHYDDWCKNIFNSSAGFCSPLLLFQRLFPMDQCPLLLFISETFSISLYYCLANLHFSSFLSLLPILLSTVGFQMLPNLLASYNIICLLSSLCWLPLLITIASFSL